MTNMTGYNADTSIQAKLDVPGIGPVADGPAGTARLITLLERLELCPPNLGVSLKALAAAGQPVKDYLTISVHALDAKLRSVNCTFEQRLGFKRSLERNGFLSAVGG